VGVTPASFWEKPWQLALIGGLLLLVLAPLIVGALQASNVQCKMVAACLTGDPRFDEHRPCLDATKAPPPHPC
jgi:hypothetical protein